MTPFDACPRIGIHGVVRIYSSIDDSCRVTDHARVLELLLPYAVISAKFWAIYELCVRTVFDRTVELSAIYIYTRSFESRSA